MKTGKQYLILIMVVVVLGVIMVKVQAKQPVTIPAATYTPYTPNTSNTGTAAVKANVIIRSMLKAPSTADFSITPSITVKPVTKGNMTSYIYSVNSYVDAQNSFGAKLRNDFTIILAENIGDAKQRGNSDYDMLHPITWTVIDAKLHK